VRLADGAAQIVKRFLRIAEPRHRREFLKSQSGSAYRPLFFECEAQMSA
jgi:hypothetical protein